MKIVSDDNIKTVNVGSSDILFSLYSTICLRVNNAEKKMPFAMKFLNSGKCLAENATETARQINLIRDALASVSPQKVVYDYTDIKKKAPWGDNISPVITSAANYFTTADGEDLLYEIVKILVYGGVAKQNITISA